MLLLPPRHATENERARKHVIPTVGERLLERNNGKVEEVRQEVEAEKHGGQIGRQKYMDEVDKRMIIMGN